MNGYNPQPDSPGVSERNAAKGMVMRKLGPFEQAMTLTGRVAPFNVVGVLCLERMPDAALLEAALARVTEQQPMLRACVDYGSGAPVFHTRTDRNIPFVLTARSEPTQWKSIVEEELNRPIPEDQAPLWHVRALRDETGSGEIIWTAHHLITDGVSMTHLFQKLLEYCSMPRDQWPHVVRMQGPACEKRFPGTHKGLRFMTRLLSFMGRQMLDEIRFRLRKKRVPPIREGGLCRILTTSLDVEETQALSARARRERVTLPNVLHTAMQEAVHQSFYQGVKQPLRGITFADLRPWLQPPVDASECGCFVSMSRFTCMQGDGSDFWTRARHMGKQNWQAARRGEKFLTPALSKVMMKTLFKRKSERMGATALSYTGITPQFGDIWPVKALHGFVSNMYLGPELTALAHIHDGRLSWDFQYLDSDMDRAMACALVTRVKRILNKALEEPDAVVAPATLPAFQQTPLKTTR